MHSRILEIGALLEDIGSREREEVVATPLLMPIGVIVRLRDLTIQVLADCCKGHSVHSGPKYRLDLTYVLLNRSDRTGP